MLHRVQLFQSLWTGLRPNVPIAITLKGRVKKLRGAFAVPIAMQPASQTPFHGGQTDHQVAVDTIPSLGPRTAPRCQLDAPGGRDCLGLVGE